VTVLDRLRDETAEAHRRIEATVDLPSRLRSLVCYRDLLARFHGFHASWEPRMIAALGTVFESKRRKLELLQHDLRALGLQDDDIHRLPACPHLPALRTRSQAFGSMYVLEGATLGGRIIASAVQQRLGLSAAHGCRYFHGYGAETDLMWRTFRVLVLAQSTDDDGAEMIASARATFDCLRSWLADVTPPPAIREPPAAGTESRCRAHGTLRGCSC
jgi:heme oxygenase